ncbi:MAG: polyhydroxyalkanoate synthesis regulator DNA-binding domain-containing protein [Phycisphaerae bacterium]
MNVGEPENVRIIKKYPNRRYYDTSQSCHVTLDQMHALVLEGQDLQITDSKTGEDITNVVLLQMILEKEQPKLDVFPSSIIHLMIRSNRHVLRTSLDSIFGPLWTLLSQSQKQFEAFWRQNYPGQLMSPTEWTTRMMQTFNPMVASPPSPPPRPEPTPPVDPPEEGEPPDRRDRDRALDELRRQVADLTDRIEQMNAEAFGPNDGETGVQRDAGVRD